MKIWSMKIPPKVQLFIWKLEYNVLPTTSFLRHRLNIDISTNCKWCNQEVETHSQLFGKCSVTKVFWGKVANWWSLDNRRASLIYRDFWAARKIFSWIKLKSIWNVVLSAELWTHRLGWTELIFQGVRLPILILNF